MVKRNITGSNQLWPVVLLLAITVILPTVSLLWFMTRAIESERLAVRQRLEEVYRNHCQATINDDFIQINLSMLGTSGLLVFDSECALIFPIIPEEDSVDIGLFARAFELEFQEKNHTEALKEYKAILANSEVPEIRIQADVAIARCLVKSQQPDQAIERLTAIIDGYDDSPMPLRIEKSRAYLLLLELMPDKQDQRFSDILAQAYNYFTQQIADDSNLGYVARFWPDRPDFFLNHAIPSELQIFALSRYLEYAENLPSDQTVKTNIQWAKKLINLLATSLDVAQSHASATLTPPQTGGGLFSLDSPEPLYATARRRHGWDYTTRWLIFTHEYTAKWLDSYVEKFEQLPAACRFYDQNGQFVTGSAVDNPANPFIEMPISDWLPGWTMRLYVDDMVFDDFAGQQAAVYTWTTILVVVVIMSFAAASTQIISRQIKLNRLKNDFIATVTHELKTPLSSMRVLVDTLLEDRHSNPKQTTEYLELISRENLRLSRLIDNFLTFSRMERNKQAFNMSSVNPAQIAKAASDAVQTKFDHPDCDFSLTVDDDLPPIIADKEALVTVLVNLLDNAYKYSYNHKQIELNVSGRPGYVCFSVKDNGIGMTRPQIKKAFDRFYQADNSLARRAQGCGLGLAIVKYILDAHKATIMVDSKPEKGSVFMIKIPVNVTG